MKTMKMLPGCVVGIAILFLSVSHSSAAVFPDVSASHPASAAVSYLQSEGIIDGYPDGLFRPDANVNRAEFTKMVVGSISTAAVCTDNAGVFPDVPANQWFAAFVCKASGAGMVDGYPDGLFRPANDITFSEAAKILARAFVDSSLQDSPDTWYKAYVDALAERGVIPPGIRSFSRAVTRAEMAEMLYRLRADIRSLPTKTYDEIQKNTEEDAQQNSLSGYYAPAASSSVAGSSISATQLSGTLLKARSGSLLLRTFALPAGFNTAIIAVTAKDPDDYALYQHDPVNHRFTYMTMNGLLADRMAAPVVSPDERRIIWFRTGHNAPSSLWMGNLTGDTAGKIVQLGTGESLSASISFSDLLWVDNFTVRYRVMGADGTMTDRLLTVGK
ncbi:MAG: secreted protein [Candidatus Peribacteria bacterium]|nr:secreted protein [Candidatus Peribacteria bacterium]